MKFSWKGAVVVGLVAATVGCADRVSARRFTDRVVVTTYPSQGLVEVDLIGESPRRRCAKVRGVRGADLNGIPATGGYGGGYTIAGDIPDLRCDDGGGIRFEDVEALGEEPELTLTIPSRFGDLVITLEGSPLADRPLILPSPLRPGSRTFIPWEHPEEVPGPDAWIGLYSAETSGYVDATTDNDRLRPANGGFELILPPDAPNDIDSYDWVSLWAVTASSSDPDIRASVRVDGGYEDF